MYEALEKVQRIVNGGEVIFEPSEEDMNGYFLKRGTVILVDNEEDVKQACLTSSSLSTSMTVPRLRKYPFISSSDGSKITSPPLTIRCTFSNASYIALLLEPFNFVAP